MQALHRFRNWGLSRTMLAGQSPFAVAVLLIAGAATAALGSTTNPQSARASQPPRTSVRSSSSSSSGSDACEQDLVQCGVSLTSISSWYVRVCLRVYFVCREFVCVHFTLTTMIVATLSAVGHPLGAWVSAGRAPQRIHACSGHSRGRRSTSLRRTTPPTPMRRRAGRARTLSRLFHTWSPAGMKGPGALPQM
jgi:hypothetical protein